jgi:hypothetical protein
MNRLKWIDSTGGPLVLISDKNYERWSGILKRISYLDNKIEEAVNFLDADETDYGKACLINDYLGIVEVGNDIALILGDEPMMTTVFYSVNGKVLIARWCYGEDKELVDNILKDIDLNSIENWEFELQFNLSSNRQYLFDSACSSSMLASEIDGYLQLDIRQGQYAIWTSIYEAIDNTKLILHKFETTNQ